MMAHLRILGTVFFILLITKVEAQNNFTIKQAVEYAWENQYQVANADLEIERSKKKIWETTAIGLPQVNANADYQNRISIPFFDGVPDQIPPGQEFILLFAAPHNTNANVEARQLLFDGTYIVGLQAARTYANMAKEEKNKTKAQVKAEVTNAYYLCLVSDENLKTLQETKTSVEDNLMETKAMFQQGFIEQSDLDQLELSLNNIQINIDNALNQKEIALKMLKLNMGFPIEETMSLSEDLNSLIDQINFEELQKTAFSESLNPDFKILQVQEDLLRLDVKRYRMERLPTLGAFYQLSYQSYQTEFDFYKDSEWFEAQTAGLRLSVPILSSGMQGAKIAQARIELSKLQNSKDFMKKSLEVQYQSAQNTLENKFRILENRKKSLKIAEKLLNQTQIKNKEGLASSFDLAQARNQFLENQGNYINALFELLNAKNNLDELQFNPNF